MSDRIFGDPPTVELLQWLCRDSLKQNLPRSLRLWVWLHILYGQERDKLELSESFSYADWRDTFFTVSHPKGEEIPPLHDPNCPCALTTTNWLFDRARGISEPEWRQSLQQYGATPDNLDELLSSRLFGVTRRSLAGDLKILAELGWLTRKKHKYSRVENWPTRPLSRRDAYSKQGVIELNFIHPNLVTIAANLSRVIGGMQRFFLHVDYVVPTNTLDRIDNWQDQLQQIWQQTPVPCLLLIYNSAKLDRIVECVVYPVCVYYVQRATYLVAFGRHPSGEINWYNYRLDRIEKLIPLTWTDARIPQRLIVNYQTGTLPTVDYIQAQMTVAWGFDFYQNANLMLLRFDENHHRRYIQDTVRHDTFERVSYEDAANLLDREIQLPEQRIVLDILKTRSTQDAYYKAYYREDDPNVLMRLFAWRPYVEVLFPWKLRQAVANDVRREWEFYQ